MSDFPNYLADKILNSTADIGDHLVILPSRRGGAYVKRRLLSRIEATASWMPQFTTLNEWIGKLSGLNPADDLELKFACYRAYKSVMQNKAQSFSEFFSWGDLLIGDFNEIESHLIPRLPFFKELTDYSEIEHFSFLENPLTEKQESYRSFWRALPDIQTEFNKILLNQKLAYPGLMLREAIEKVKRDGIDFAGKIIVAGFNALSRGETVLLKLAQDEYHAEILYDVDAYYLDDKINHAGHFIRQNLANTLGQPIRTPLPLDQRPLEIEICTAGQRIDQAQIAVGLLSEMNADERKKTTLVLADEKLLIPILAMLPDALSKPNITMGIGLDDSTFAGWIDLIFRIASTQLETEESTIFPTDELDRFLENPFTQLLGKPNKTWFNTAPGYTPLAVLETAIQATQLEWLSALFQFWITDIPERSKALSSLYNSIEIKLNQTQKWSIDKLQALSGIALLRRVSIQIENLKLNAELDLKNYLKIMLRALSDGKLNSIGDPLDDLQIMGLLETRSLSFERLIICGVNEEILPGSSTFDSFIPFEIRSFHGLPGRKEKAAVYAYNFFRLIQHASHIQLIYNTDRSSFSGGEKSRYIQQIEYELQNQNPNLKIRKRMLADRPGVRFAENAVVEKTPEICSRIAAHLERGLSVSSINSYLEDSLNWFYKYILRAEEPEVTAIDPASFGSVVHHVFENLYLPYKNEWIGIGIIEKLMRDTPNELRMTFAKHFPTSQFDTGMNKVHFETALAMLINYFKSELKTIERGDKIQFIDAEQKVTRILSIAADNKQVDVKIIGIIDKLARRNGRLQIIDYKTGKVDFSEIKNNVKGGYSRELIAKAPKTLQLLTYNWLATEAYNEKEITAQIITLVVPNRRNLVIENSEAKNDDFENIVTEIVLEMLDPEIAFVKNPKFKYATFE